MPDEFYKDVEDLFAKHDIEFGVFFFCRDCVLSTDSFASPGNEPAVDLMFKGVCKVADDVAPEIKALLDKWKFN